MGMTSSGTQSSGYEDAIRNALSISGDSDTIAAIAGPVAEALFGISDEITAEVWRFLPTEMRNVLQDLYANIEPTFLC